MPQNTRDIKRRIKSVRNTSQITKAMEMVAASKLRRVQDAVQQSKPYLAKLQDMLANLSQSARHVKHPLLASRPVRRVGYLVITADRGLAGPYNAQVIRAALQEFGKKDKTTFSIFAVGKRGRDFFKRRDYPISSAVVDLADSPTYHSIRHLAEEIVGAYERAEFDELYFVYNEFINAVSQRAVVRKVLPLDSLTEGQPQSNRLYEFEPDEEAVMAALLPRYAETLVYQAVLDAKASEHAARMTAMGNATDNAKDLISDLTLSLNRARQAAITTQIAEIVGGAEALR
ncbi:ATP synthase F1 subunit gamma [Alicyclobacillus acidiphilus]|uniref:ATP synthase F1 subunit gamma n=1 Tax=Alicyclobacillus acidiphilus TaxID=182455 RepID=UPI000830C649|nr:ATP synthase F1 subunit gamma [Alicyclobacillus acidiphilus]